MKVYVVWRNDDEMREIIEVFTHLGKAEECAWLNCAEIATCELNES